MKRLFHATRLPQCHVHFNESKEQKSRARDAITPFGVVLHPLPTPPPDSKYKSETAKRNKIFLAFTEMGKIEEFEDR
jgi:hypothetical protein